MNEQDYFQLDPHRLDEEWIAQPALYRKAAERLADAREEYERAKAKEKVVYAEVELAVRRNPDNFGLEKATESCVRAAVEVNPSVKAVVTATITARKTMDLAQVRVDTLEHRKKALENLVVLQGRDYYAEPKAKAPMNQTRIEKAKANSAFDRRGKR